MFDTALGTLTVNTIIAFARVHMCYVCTAIPTDDSAQVGTLKTEPFEIGVGDCST